MILLPRDVGIDDLSESRVGGRGGGDNHAVGRSLAISKRGVP